MKLGQYARSQASSFAIPVVALAAGIFLYIEIVNDPNVDLTRPQNAAVWPRIMISGLMIGAFVMLLQRLWVLIRDFRTVQKAPESFDADSEDHWETIGSEAVLVSQHDNRKAVLGGLGLIGYIFALLYIGYPIATAAIMVYWLILSGWRQPLRIAIASLGVTYGVLVVFIKIAYLPLPKGAGIFNDATVGIYRTLGLF